MTVFEIEKAMQRKIFNIYWRKLRSYNKALRDNEDNIAYVCLITSDQDIIFDCLGNF